MNKAFTLAAASLAAIASGNGIVNAATPEQTPAPQYFGTVTGSYIVDAIPKDWKLFGPNTPIETNKTAPGDGWLGQALAGYRWSDWDATIGFQYVDLGAGDFATTASGSHKIYLEAKNWAIDAAIGYNDHIDSLKVRTSFGLRYAEWTSDARPYYGTRFRYHEDITHKWKGIGPRFTVEGSLPVGDALSVEGQIGLAALAGKTTTSHSPGWLCTACGDTRQTSLNADGKLGLGWSVTENTKFVLGYQYQYWSAVNVAITDDSTAGKVIGKSDYLIHGPFLSLAASF